LIGPLIDEKYVGFGDSIIKTDFINAYKVKNLTNQQRIDDLAVPFLIAGSMNIVGPILLIFTSFYLKHEPKFKEKKINE
jgi:hypothetical protein